MLLAARRLLCRAGGPVRLVLQRFPRRLVALIDSIARALQGLAVGIGIDVGGLGLRQVWAGVLLRVHGHGYTRCGLSESQVGGNSPAIMAIIKITGSWLAASSSRVGASADKEAS